MELPPRARRIHIVGHRVGTATGTTSACAENTFRGVNEILGVGNYLRVRGEYDNMFNAAKVVAELPPRARRIP